MINPIVINVPVTGAAGSAAGSATSTAPISGRVLAINVDYTAQPATCDVTITSTGPTQSILTLTNANTDGWFYPRVLLDSTVGVDLTAVYDAIPVAAYINVAVAQGDAGSVTVTLLVES